MSEHGKRKNFEKYWVRPLQDLIIEEEAQEEIVDIHSQVLAKTATVNTKEVEASSENMQRSGTHAFKKNLNH